SPQAAAEASQIVAREYRSALNEQMRELGFDVAHLTAIQLQNFLQTILQNMGDQVSDELLDMIDEWLAAEKSRESAVASVVDQQIKLNELRTQIDPSDADYLTEQEANERNLEL